MPQQSGDPNNGPSAWQRLRRLTEPENAGEMAALMGASFTPGVGTGLDAVDLAAGLQDKDPVRAGIGLIAMGLPFVGAAHLKAIKMGVGRLLKRSVPEPVRRLAARHNPATAFDLTGDDYDEWLLRDVRRDRAAREELRGGIGRALEQGDDLSTYRSGTIGSDIDLERTGVEHFVPFGSTIRRLEGAADRGGASAMKRMEEDGYNELLGEIRADRASREGMRGGIGRALNPSSEPIRKATPEELDLFRETLGNAQRDIPEKAMREVQRASGGGVADYLTEHVGDISHRMTEMMGPGSGVGSPYTGSNVMHMNVNDKIDKTLRQLESGYGVGREFDESIKSNARLRGIPEAEHRASVEAALDAYADAHAALPVYNEAQRLARDAAVAVGRRNFAESADLLRQLKKIASDESVFRRRSREFGFGG